MGMTKILINIKKMLDSHRALSTSKHHCYLIVAKLTTYLLVFSNSSELLKSP